MEKKEITVSDYLDILYPIVCDKYGRIVKEWKCRENIKLQEAFMVGYITAKTGKTSSI